METESSASNGAESVASPSSNALPSLFGDNVVNGIGGSSKDLDGLIAMSDTTLSQQIEFILQDAPMEQDEEEESTANKAVTNVTSHRDSPPTPTPTLTRASPYSRTVQRVSTIAPTTQVSQDHLLNGRRIIIQSTASTRMVTDAEEKPDPELNDENLQDIEEEAAEAEEEEIQLSHTQIKLERPDSEDEESNGHMEFMNNPTITHHTALAAQPPQLLLPAGSIVSTTSRTLNGTVSEALAQLQRRPVYISNTVAGMSGATFVRMPAVISRSPMAVLNVVQQNVARGTPTTQLILQAAPSSSTTTSVVVTSSSAAAAIAATAASPPTPTIVASSPTATAISSSLAGPATSKATGHTGSATALSVLAAASRAATPTYQCVECVEKFESKELFDIHRSGHANNMKCAICNMVLKSLKNYEKHCLRCKPYECQICGRVVRFRPNFIKHMRVHTGQQSERHKYKCDVCHKEFMSFEYFKVHKKIHNENVNLTCEICGKVFSALASLRGHSKLHSGVKLHKCDVCGKGFGQRYNLKIHARTHTGDFPFECKICKKKLHTQSSLQTHMQVHQRDQTSQVTTTIKYEQNANPPSTAAAAAASSSAVGVPTATIVKLEQQTSLDGPSTSGLQHRRQDDRDDSSEMEGHRMVSSVSNARHAHPSTAEDSSDSSDSSDEVSQQPPQHLLIATPTRTIVINNYLQNEQNLGVIAQQQTQVIQSGVHINHSALQQQLLRKTPIIQSTGGATSLSSALASVVHQRGSSASPSPPSSSTSCSSSVVVSKSGAPLSLASAAIGTSTIRSTRNHSGSHGITSNQRTLQRNNHRNHHRNRHPTRMDDEDDDDDDHLHNSNGSPYDDYDDDDKSSPSLATTAIIKVEPNLYSSGSGDNSNELLIKEEVMFEDSSAAHSPHSPPSSKYGISNFENELVDHHVDLNHSLPPYGNLFEPHSIPDSIPAQLYADDDDDFRLDHSSLGGLQNTSSSTTDGDYIKKEWVYGAGSGYTMNGKFDDDSDALCDATNFIYH